VFEIYDNHQTDIDLRGKNNAQCICYKDRSWIS